MEMKKMKGGGNRKTGGKKSISLPLSEDVKIQRKEVTPSLWIFCRSQDGKIP